MITFRTVMTDNGECPSCGNNLIPGDPLYRVGFSLRHRLVCGACAWRKEMKHHPKYADNGWPAVWAHDAPRGHANRQASTAGEQP